MKYFNMLLITSLKLEIFRMCVRISYVWLHYIILGEFTGPTGIQKIQVYRELILVALVFIPLLKLILECPMH